MINKHVAVYCKTESIVIGHLIVYEGEFKLTSDNFVAMFSPSDPGHRLERQNQRDGQFARCVCGGILEIHPDKVEFSEKCSQPKNSTTLTREQARALAVSIAQTSGVVHRQIHNKDNDANTAILLGQTKIRVS